MRFKFIKEFSTKDKDRWYVDLPEWEGDKERLEMVQGADTLLDLLDEDCLGVVYLDVDTDRDMDNTNGYDFILKFKEDEAGGGTYILEHDLIQTFDVWLCSVTIFVYKYLPSNLYCNVIKI